MNKTIINNGATINNSTLANMEEKIMNTMNLVNGAHVNRTITVDNAPELEVISITATDSTKVKAVKNTAKKLVLERTTALKVQTLAQANKVTDAEVASYVAMYPSFNDDIDTIIKWWGEKATPYKVSSGKGIAKARIKAMEDELAMRKMAATIEPSTAKAQAEQKADNAVDATTEPVAEETKKPEKVAKKPVNKPVKEHKVRLTDEELLKHRIENMFKTFFINNPKAARARYNEIIANLVVNAANCKQPIQAGAMDFITVYMAEDAICKAIWNQWRNRTKVDSVKQGFLHMTLNKLCSNGVLIPIYNNRGRLIGFKVTPENIAKYYGSTDMQYKAFDGTEFIVNATTVKCMANNVEKDVSIQVLHWLAKNACLVCINGITKPAPKGAGKATKPDADKAVKDTANEQQQPKQPVAEDVPETGTVDKTVQEPVQEQTTEPVNGEDTVEDNEPFKDYYAPKKVQEPLTKEEQEAHNRIKKAWFSDDTNKPVNKDNKKVEIPKEEKKPVDKVDNRPNIADMTMKAMFDLMISKKISEEIFANYLGMFPNPTNIEDINNIRTFEYIDAYGWGATPNTVKAQASA